MTLCLIFIFINLIGVKEAGRVQVVLVLCILSALLVYIVRGLPNVQIHNFAPFSPKGMGTVFSTAGFVFVSYGGLLKVASLAEEVKNPGRVLPLAMILSFLVVASFYTMVIFVTIGVLDSNSLDSTLTPISDGAAVFMGSFGKIILSIAAILAFTSATNAGIMGASRYPLALSRDDLLPKFFGKINPKFKTPHFAVIITGVIMIAALFLKINTIVKAASSILILTYILPCLAVIILRESHLQNYQPRFRAPLYPWLQIIGSIGFGFLLVELGKEALLANSILIIGGLFIYWFYGRIRVAKDYALLHLIERITAKELATNLLESELKEIIRERDNITRDRFDDIIEQCTVLDIDKALHVEAFFELVSKVMAEKLGVRQKDLLKLLLDRERETSTVIGPCLAIPHIIIEGSNHFDVLLVRCREGVFFSASDPSVHAIFVLVGTRDERNFHLRTLAAFAQIIQDPHFKEKWLKAKNEQALRDIILLGERRR